MTEKEVELIAELLAKVGGTWFPERAGLARKPVTSRQRDVARLVLAELERAKAAKQAASAASTGDGDVTPDAESRFAVGQLVEYSPPGDKRAMTCRIEKLDRGRAYLVTVGREVGWVSTHTFLPLKS